MIVGSAVKANTKPRPAPNTLSIAGWSASTPKTNCDPAFVNSRNCFTASPTRLKNAYPGRTPPISSFRMKSARPSCSAMPQATVRQLTARRSRENAATIAMKQTTPRSPCTRGLMLSRSTIESAAMASATPAAVNRSARSLRGGGAGASGMRGTRRSLRSDGLEDEPRRRRRSIAHYQRSRRERYGRVEAALPVAQEQHWLAGRHLSPDRCEDVDTDAVIDLILQPR